MPIIVAMGDPISAATGPEGTVTALRDDMRSIMGPLWAFSKPARLCPRVMPWHSGRVYCFSSASPIGMTFPSGITFFSTVL
jgi:hypothetical protein